MKPHIYPPRRSLIGFLLLFLLIVFPSAATFAAESEVEALLSQGRSQYLAGEPMTAAQTFTRVLELEPDNTVAKGFLQRIAAGTVDGNASRVQSAAQMLNEVQRGWQRPGAVSDNPPGTNGEVGPPPLLAKLEAIVIPSVNFSGLELGRVVNTLSAISEEFDPSVVGSKGVNVVLLDPANANPLVHITLRNLPLRRVLELITGSVGYEFELTADAVIVRPGAGKADLGTEFFAVSRSTVLRLTGRGNQPQAASGGSGDALTGVRANSEPSGPSHEGAAIKIFLELAGVGFDAEAGCTLAFDGSQLIVTQTRRNLERIRNILNRYHDVRQVEIEARFMEVQDGALEELGVNWSVSTKAAQQNARVQALYQTANRSLADAFTNQSNNGQGRIVGGESGLDQAIPNNPPTNPGANNLGLNTPPLATLSGSVGEFNVNAVVRALAQKSGTELLSAPKLTVLSGNPATITVAQELRYPKSYGQVQSQVGTGSSSGGGSAGVAITAGTPQDFTTRNIGVELKVTPTVEEDNHSISLELNPRVTEFEGFVEYGGQSIAIAGNPPTTVTIPSGFYQPIFGVRELTTKVTIWDGATIMMGGLTREDVRKANDKVPVLGNVPVLGRLFRSRGESTQKRNLLIFVTANLVSPGGSFKKPVASNAPAGSFYRNPEVVALADPAGEVKNK